MQTDEVTALVELIAGATGDKEARIRQRTGGDFRLIRAEVNRLVADQRLDAHMVNQVWLNASLSVRRAKARKRRAVRQ